MGKLNLLILCMLCSSTTAQNESTVEPDVTTNTSVPNKGNPMRLNWDYSDSGYDYSDLDSSDLDSSDLDSPEYVGYDYPGYDYPGYGYPGYGYPGYGSPGYGSPGYGSPGYVSPGYGSPGYGSPGYGSPGYGSPGYGSIGVGWKPSLPWGPIAGADDGDTPVMDLMVKLEAETEKQMKVMRQQQIVIKQMIQELNDSPTSQTEPPGSGYTMYPNIGSYKFHKELITWNEAKRVCEDEHAHLAIINSQREADLLVKIFASNRISLSPEPNPKDYIYLGFSDQKTEGVYVTVSGYLLEESGYTRWMPGQPDNGGRYFPEENCGAMHKTGLLDDVHCTQFKVPFICEKDLRYN